MATIGTFTKSGDTFTGSVKTLSINAKTTIRAADKGSDKAPDYRVFCGAIEYGAAWKKTSSEGRAYLSVKLDDPSFPVPILRHPGRGRRRGQLQPHLVPPQRGLIDPPQPRSTRSGAYRATCEQNQAGDQPGRWQRLARERPQIARDKG